MEKARKNSIDIQKCKTTNAALLMDFFSLHSEFLMLASLSEIKRKLNALGLSHVLEYIFGVSC